MKLILPVFVLILVACQSFEISSTAQQDTPSNIHEVFTNAFNNPECFNPCWLSIEVGRTNRETIITILEENSVEYGVPGVIHLYSIPDGTLPAAQPQEVTPPAKSPDVFGNINVGQQNNDIVQSLDFSIDLCVSTILDAYGVPSVWFTQDGIPTILVYLDYQLFFTVDIVTLRVDGVILHTEENMPSSNELENWSEYTDSFPDNCTDGFSEILE